MSETPRDRAQIEEMKGCVCFALRRTTRAVTQLYDAALRPHRIRITQMPILVAASRPERVPLAPLADALGMERTTLLRNVRPLVRRKLLESTPDEGGRTGIRTTPAGRALLARLYPAWRRVQSQLLESLADPGWNRTLSTLNKAADRGPE